MQVVLEHSKLLEKHRMMTSTKDTLLEELKTVRSAANVMERDLKEQVKCHSRYNVTILRRTRYGPI